VDFHVHWESSILLFQYLRLARLSRPHRGNRRYVQVFRRNGTEPPSVRGAQGGLGLTQLRVIEDVLVTNPRAAALVAAVKAESQFPVKLTHSDMRIRCGIRLFELVRSPERAIKEPDADYLGSGSFVVVAAKTTPFPPGPTGHPPHRPF
jgi:hypothetical protein